MSIHTILPQNYYRTVNHIFNFITHVNQVICRLEKR